MIINSAIDAAVYLLKLDKQKNLLKDTSMMIREGRKFYVGNARLNKYLHLAQNIYFAKTGRLLFHEKIYAYDNGGVVEEVRTKYSYLVEKENEIQADLSEDRKVFLDKIYVVLHNATLDDLFELSHQDGEWEDKHSYYKKEDQIMDTESRLEEYKKQYADIITLMEGMNK